MVDYIFGDTSWQVMIYMHCDFWDFFHHKIYKIENADLNSVSLRPQEKIFSVGNRLWNHPS